MSYRAVPYLFMCVCRAISVSFVVLSYIREQFVVVTIKYDHILYRIILYRHLFVCRALCQLSYYDIWEHFVVVNIRQQYCIIYRVRIKIKTATIQSITLSHPACQVNSYSIDEYIYIYIYIYILFLTCGGVVL